ncbi:hypothetical protein LF41_1388 [Lysobacter dokdonensis DS-58]|uniref:Lipoprotein n=1 Tax=Lysobacter dokdonensis DS-58 TaxID=1300345 RepID=A0A0A2WF57_9GAMM|nr:hypothetical protein [Lysobacter dokdonensis]KGQ18388.1 hypothetical protein LF41_1388 [Lysobacter dokdonensis DS-58]
MNRNRVALSLATALIATLAVAGCKKKEAEMPATTTTPPAATTLPPISAPAPSTASASVTSVELGNAAGPDMKIAAPTSTFTTKDKIIAAVGTRAGDAAASTAKIAAKWTHVDSNQTVNEESRDVQLQGDQTWDFEITNSNPWPTGKYKVEVSLNGSVVQSRDFEVK